LDDDQADHHNNDDHNDRNNDDHNVQTVSMSDWDWNKAVNHPATATANWASVKHQHTDEDIQKLSP
jgi:hypothetical protein